MSTLVHSPSEVLQSYFVAQGLGTLGALPQAFPFSSDVWPIFASYMPPEGDQAICIYDTTAVEEGRLMAGMNISYPGIQILVRHPKEQQVYDKVYAFRTTLQQIKDAVATTSDGVSYLIRCASNIRLPMRVGQEIGKNRIIYSLNTTITVDEYNQ